MIVDIHTHDFPDRIAVDTVRFLSQKAHIHPFDGGTSAHLERYRQEAGIDLSVVLPVATSPRQVRHINEKAAMRNEQTGQTGLLSFACIHPDMEDCRAELKYAAELGLKGVKLHPVYQETDLDDIRFLRIIDCAAQLGMIVITHSGLDIGYPGAVHCSPQMARHVVEEIGDFPFILAHMGGWREWDRAVELLADTRVYLDTSFSTGKICPLPDGYWQEEELGMMDEEQFMEMVRAFGAERILFGTDHPWADAGESLAFIRRLPLTGRERDMILGENAARLLHVDIT